VEHVVGPVLAVTQFPSLQLESWLESDWPSVLCCLATGYAFGLAVGHYAAVKPTAFSVRSLIRWTSVMVLLTDVVCVIALTPGIDAWPRMASAFLFTLLVLVPVTLTAGVCLLIRRRGKQT